MLGAVYMGHLLLSGSPAARDAVSKTTLDAPLWTWIGGSSVLEKATDYARALSGWGVIGFQVLGLMLFGVAWVQSGWLRRMLHGSFWNVKVDVALWVTGALFNALFVASEAASDEGWWIVSYRMYTASFILGGTLLGGAISLGVLRLLGGRRMPWLRILAPAGQMSVSIYLFGTVCFVGLASVQSRFGHLGNGAALLVAVALFGALVLVASLLRQRGVGGPIEVLWRTLAYGGRYWTHPEYPVARDDVVGHSRPDQATPSPSENDAAAGPGQDVEGNSPKL